MHFDFSLIIRKVLSSSSVASPYSIRALNFYRVLVNNKVINARHVRIIENETVLICLGKRNHNNNSDYDNNSLINLNFESESEENDDMDRNKNENEATVNNNNQLPTISTIESCKDKQTNIENVEIDNVQDKINSGSRETDSNLESANQQNLNVKRTSNRKKSPVNRYGNPVTHYIYVNYVNANVPNTFEEVINCNEHKE